MFIKLYLPLIGLYNFKLLYFFESAIQGVLLYVALNVGNISEGAKRFIKDNFIYSDIFIEVNSMGKRKLFSKWIQLNWDNIFTSGLDKNTLLEIVYNATGVCVQNFVYPFSQVDRDIESINFANEISSHVKLIIQAFCSPEIISGDIEHDIDVIQKTMDGITAGMKVFNEAFLMYWKGSETID